jgi:hypothetical protein
MNMKLCAVVSITKNIDCDTLLIIHLVKWALFPVQV